MGKTILFSGQHGQGIGTLLEELADFLSEHHNFSSSIHCAEDGLPLPSFLFESYWQSQSLRWNRSFSFSEKEICASNEDFHFLSMHLVMMRNGVIVSPFSLPLIDPQLGCEPFIESLQKKIAPEMLVNIIDNVYSIQSRMKSEFRIRLYDILIWRSWELNLSDFLAKQILYSKNSGDHLHYMSILLSKNHSKSTIAKLIVSPDTVRVYLSFPITSTRGNPDRKKEIDRFREIVSESFVSFDPLTIDERPLSRLLTDYLRDYCLSNSSIDEPAICSLVGKSNVVSLIKLYRNSGGVPLSEVELNLENEYLWNGNLERSLKLNAAEVSDIVLPYSRTGKSIIDKQIELRDYRLIDQSDLSIIYRPQYGGRKDWSGGTSRESTYCQNCSKRTYVIHDPKHDGDFSPRAFRSELMYVFDQIGDLHEPQNQKEVLEEVLSAIQEESAKIKVSRRN